MLEYYLYSKHCTRQQLHKTTIRQQLHKTTIRQQLHKTTVAQDIKKAPKPEREPSPIESLFVFVGFFGL